MPGKVSPDAIKRRMDAKTSRVDPVVGRVQEDDPAGRFNFNTMGNRSGYNFKSMKFGRQGRDEGLTEMMDRSRTSQNQKDMLKRAAQRRTKKASPPKSNKSSSTTRPTISATSIVR